MQGVHGDTVGFCDIGDINVLYPPFFQVGYQDLVLDDKTILLQPAIVQAAHEMHQRAQVSELALLQTASPPAAVAGGHIAEERITIIGNDMLVKIANKGFQPVFEVISQRLVLDDQRVHGGDGETPAFYIIPETQGLPVLDRAGSGIFRGADEVVEKGLTPLLPSIFQVGLNGDSFQLGGADRQHHIHDPGEVAGADLRDKGAVANG